MPAAEPEPGAGVFLQSAAADGLCLCPGGQLPQQSRAALCFPPYTPRPTAALRPEEKVLPQVLRHDVLLFYPFQSMDPFLHLVREAASDPCVLSIKITITAWPPRPSWRSIYAQPPKMERKSPS